MSIYVEEVVGELNSLLDYATRMLAKFEANVAAPELLLDTGVLENRLENADRILPDGVSIDWGRKLHFMKYYLRQGQPELCQGDLERLCAEELPSVIEQVKGQSSTSLYLDAELRALVSPLIRTRQYNSAIRAAFVLLTERMRKKFNLAAGTDGAAMVNTVFGSASTHFASLTNPERQARRDYLSGLYGVLRNKYAHSEPAFDQAELEAVLSGVNMALKIIG
jgi:hypothetical protein